MRRYVLTCFKWLIVITAVVPLFVTGEPACAAVSFEKVKSICAGLLGIRPKDESSVIVPAKVIVRNEDLPHPGLGEDIYAGMASYVRPIDFPIMTDNLIMCAGVGLVNRRTGEHALFHIAEDGMKKKNMEAVLDAWGENFLDGADLYVMPGTRLPPRMDRQPALPHATKMIELIQNYYANHGLKLSKTSIVQGVDHPVLFGTMLLSGGQVFTLSGQVNPRLFYREAIHHDPSFLQSNQLAHASDN